MCDLAGGQDVEVSLPASDQHSDHDQDAQNGHENHPEILLLLYFLAELPQSADKQEQDAGKHKEESERGTNAKQYMGISRSRQYKSEQNSQTNGA